MGHSGLSVASHYVCSPDGVLKGAKQGDVIGTTGRG